MRRAIGLATACAVVAGSVWGPACYDHSCDPGPVVDFATKTTTPDAGRQDVTYCGDFISPDEWESSPADGDWIDYGPQTTLKLIIPNWIGDQREFVDMHAYISETRHPATAEGANYTEATGNVAEFSRASPGVIWLANATCAHFYVRVLLRAGPATGAAAQVDGGPPTNAPPVLGPPTTQCDTP